MKLRQTNFTLLELITSVTLFSVVMVILVFLFNTFLKQWKIQQSLAQTTQKAQLIMHILERDFDRMAVSDELTEEIPFAIMEPKSDDGPFPFFVSIEPNSSNSCSDLAEVTYKVDSAVVEGQVKQDWNDNDVKFFKRSVVHDVGSSGPNKTWDFYGMTKQHTVKSWTNYPRPYAVVDGVKSCYFQYFFIEDGEIVERSVGVYNKAPAIISVELTLYDPAIESPENAYKTLRTYSRLFYINQKGMHEK